MATVYENFASAVTTLYAGPLGGSFILRRTSGAVMMPTGMLSLSLLATFAFAASFGTRSSGTPGRC